MRKTLVALSVATFVATSASAVTVYNNNGTQLDVSGSARVMLTKKTDNRTDLQNDGSRIKFKFSQQIGDGFSALGFVELRPSDDNFGGGITTKYIYAGLQADNVGALTFGRQKTSGDAFKLADPAEQDIAINDGLGLTTNAQKVIRFSSASFYGLGLDASYIFDNDASKGSNTAAGYNTNANGYQLLAKYENTFGEFGFKAHALYGHQKYDNGTSTTNTDKSQNTWGLAAAVSYADLGFAVDYATTKLNGNAKGLSGITLPANNEGNGLSQNFTKAKGVQLALTYQVTDPVDVYALYHAYTYTDKDNVKTSTHGFALGTHYYLTQNIMTYLEFNRDKYSNATDANNAGYIGLRVFF